MKNMEKKVVELELKDEYYNMGEIIKAICMLLT